MDRRPNYSSYGRHSTESANSTREINQVQKVNNKPPDHDKQKVLE